MAVRIYAMFAALVTLGMLLYAADRGDYVRMPWHPAADARLQSATLKATWTVDLETGNQGTPRADLHWGMQARDQPYLGAYEGGTGMGPLIAQAGAARWEDLDEAALAKLSYAPARYSAWGTDAPVRKGALLVQVAQKAIAQDAVQPAAWHARRDEALAAYKAQRWQDALDACGRAVESAEKSGEAQHALALVTCGGLVGLHRRAARQMEDWLRQGVALSGRLEQRAIVAALGPREALLKERALRMLGVFYRDQNRTRLAAENFALAVDTVRALPPPETADHRLALRSDLHDLGVALAQIGLHGTARQALGESRELYLQTEPGHPALKSIDAQLQRLDAPEK
jgi:tetratricopeptide (TPR) repeat protein